MLAMLTEAPPVFAAPLAEVVVVAPLALDEAGLDAGVVAVVVGVELVVVVVAGVDGDGTGAPLVDDPAGVEALPEELKQVVVPGLMVNGAEEAVVPVLSRMVRPTEVPAAILTTHVREVPVC